MDTITAVTAMLILVSLMMTLYIGGSPLITADASKAKSARIEDTLGELGRITAKNQTLRQLLDTANTAPASKRLAVDVASLQSLISSQSSNLDQLHERMVRQVELARKTADKLGRGEEQERIEETKRQMEAERETNQLLRVELDDVTKRTTELDAKIEKAKRDRSLVFYIRPSGIAQFQRLSTLAKGAGFTVGYDAIEEDRQILFSQPTQEP